VSKEVVYEVRTEFSSSDGTITYVVETRRTSRDDAESDLLILKFLGKKGWIVEV